MKKLLLFLTIITSLLAPVALLGTVGAQQVTDPIKPACDQAKGATKPDICKNSAAPSSNPLTGPNGIIIKASRVIATLTAIAAVIVIMIAGFRYITSTGDPSSINAAKNAILYAIIGLVVSILAPFIIGFVLQKF